MSAPQLQTGKESENLERTRPEEGLYLVPSLFTAANILMGFYSVMSALRAFSVDRTERLWQLRPAIWTMEQLR